LQKPWSREKTQRWEQAKVPSQHRVQPRTSDLHQLKLDAAIESVGVHVDPDIGPWFARNRIAHKSRPETFVVRRGDLRSTLFPPFDDDHACLVTFADRPGE